MKIVAYLFAFVFVFLLVTNPNIKDFKEFIPEGLSLDGQFVRGKLESVYSRESNFLLFSIYERADVIRGKKHISKRYLGVCKNFIFLSRVRYSNRYY